MKMILQALVSLLILDITICSKTSRRLQNLNQQPDIWLFGYIQTDGYKFIPADKRSRGHENFFNDFVTKNGSDFIIAEEAEAVIFSCEAAYPVTWEFPFPEQLKYINRYDMGLKNYRVSTLGSYSMEPSNKKFQIIFEITSFAVQFLSLNLTCSSINITPEAKSSVHIYLNGKMELENLGKTLQVFLDESPKQSIFLVNRTFQPVVIPCRPALPQMQVSLEKQTRNHRGKKWLRLTLKHEIMIFDPKIGFTLDGNFYGDRIFGLFRCKVLDENEDLSLSNLENKDDNQYVFVNVSLASANDYSQSSQINSNIQMNLESKSIFHGKASMKLEQYTIEDGKIYTEPNVKCCAGVKNKPPRLFARQCENLLSCQLAKKQVLDEIATEKMSLRYDENRLVNGSTDCLQQNIYGAATVIICQGESIDFVDTFVDLIHPLAGSPVKDRFSRILKASPKTDEIKKLMDTNDDFAISLSQYESLTNVKAANISQKMLIIIGRNISSKQPRGQRNTWFSTNDPLDLSEDEPAEDIIIHESRQWVNLEEYDRDEYYEGEFMIFMCFGVKYFYDFGPHLRINYKNGTKTIIEKPNKISEKNDRYNVYLSDKCEMFNAFGDDVVYNIFGSPLVANKDMKSVDCWMPQSNSEKWDKLSKHINILPSVAPKFAEEEEEVLYFYLGDTGNKIVCTIVEGLPVPSLKINRNGVNQKIIVREANYSSAENDNMNELKLKPGKVEVESMKMESNQISGNIYFSKITHDHQGVIQCTASNVNRTATRTVNVVVIKKSSIAYIVTLSMAGILCLVLIGLGVRRWFLKRIVASLRTTLF